VTRTKSFDTFTPVGPRVVTADEVPDPTRQGISCEVDGEVLQRASTGDLHRSHVSPDREIIAYLDQDSR
jgi:2-keto-4-pentenoate hydratase/2-oxohepta-3-ene-1,7-dioic acid hydratase in catechol pathway